MKNQNGPKRCWRIRGYDGSTDIFDQSVPIGQITESSMKELLRALVAKSLSPREVVGAYAKRGTRISNEFLEIHKENQVDKRRTLYTCGTNPHFIATTDTCE
jgi:hypothetical protein